MRSRSDSAKNDPAHCKSAFRWGDEPELFGPLHSFRVGLMVRTLRELLPRGRVLDAGCGAGSLTMALSKQGYDVDGVDISGGFCEYVWETLCREGLRGKASIVRANIGNLPFRHAEFDGLMCGDVLEHVSDDEAALVEFKRVLRPGGVLVMTVPVNKELWDESDAWAGHARRYEVDELFGLVQRRGFVVSQMETYGFPFGRIYHRLVTRSIAANSGRREKTVERFATFKRWGREPLVVGVLATILGLDRLLSNSSRASGVMIACKKHGDS